jgi:hypothetical protein
MSNFSANARCRWLGLRAAHVRELSERAAGQEDNVGSSAASASAPGAGAGAGAGAFAQAHLQELSQHDARKIRALLAALRQDSHVRISNLTATSLQTY